MQARKILTLVLITATIASCSMGLGNGSGSGSGMASSGGSHSGPGISGYTFFPALITTSSGATVTWTNYDGVSHTVTDAAGSPAFDSGPIAPGASYSVMLTLPGTYTYKCTIHPTMTHATIKVQ
jgi:plastocyanin